MTEMPSNYQDFASYLHDPQNIKFATDEEKKAMSCGFRMERFVEGYNVRDTVFEFLEPYFRSRTKLETSGLRDVYRQIREKILETPNGFCLLLIGYYHMRDSTEHERVLNKYTTQSGNEITITVDSFCRCILKEFFTDFNERDRLCKATPNYDIYKHSAE